MDKQTVVYPNNGIVFGHKKKVFIPPTTWMNLENMPSERSQSQKTRYYTILLIANAQNRQIDRDRK